MNQFSHHSMTPNKNSWSFVVYNNGEQLGYSSSQAEFPHPRSCQRLNLLSSPATNLMFLGNYSHPTLFLFKSLHPQELLTSLDIHWPHSSLYFVHTILLQRWSLLSPQCHSHLPNNAWLKVPNFLSFNTPFLTGEQIIFPSQGEMWIHRYHSP